MQNTKIDYKNIYYPPGGILLWIIISLELITFGIALIALVVSSKNDPQLYHDSRLELNTTFGAINTLFLLTSGAFMAAAVHQFKVGNYHNTSKYILWSMLGGVFFLILKGIEYYLKIESGHTLGYNTFYTYYWLLTAFHVIHVLVGLTILSFIIRALEKEKLLITDLEAGAAFWHMCDLIWLLLFPVLYLIL